MRSQFARLFWAAILSGCGFFATIYWYKSTEKPVSTLGALPLAQVGKVGDEVLRRSATRLLWRGVNTGDTLYNGESIRTSERGEVRIQFDDGRFIDLESDSMIVLQKSKGEIALDLMEGSVFVNAKSTETASDPSGQAAPSLVLNSKQGRVDLTGASASLAKGKGNQLNMQVLEGSATIQGKDGKSHELLKGSAGELGGRGLSFDQSKLQILSPILNKPLYVNSDEISKITFQWKGFSPEWKVSLWAGHRRKEISERESQQSPGLSITSQFSLGKHYWKLVAKDPATGSVVAESPIYRLEVIGRVAPSVIFPIADAKIELTQPTYDMNFKWEKGDETRLILLEIASDPLMRKKLAVKSFTTEDQFQLPQLKEGDYFWRMSAYFSNSEKPLVGKVQRFALRRPPKVVPKEPAQINWLTSDANTIQYFVTEPTLKMDWVAKTRSEEIVQWQMKVQDLTGSAESALKFDSKEPTQKVVLPKAGHYQVLVEGLNKDGEVVGKSSERKMEIAPTPLLKAPNLLPLNAELRAQESGRSLIQWESIQGAKEYLLIIKNDGGQELVRKKYQKTSTRLQNLMPGKYHLQVLAVDEWGRKSEEIPVRSLLVPELSDVRAPSGIRVKVKEE